MIINVFADVHMLIKQLKAVFMPNCNIYNSIPIVIAFDLIHNNFKTKMLSLLKISNKTIDKI